MSNCVQVYELIGTRWVDQGTAFCLFTFNPETQEAFIVARSEANYEHLVLTTAIRSNDVYQRQQETLIVWTEPDGSDYALSFQDPEGCAEIWGFIVEVQQHLNANGRSKLVKKGTWLNKACSGCRRNSTNIAVILAYDRTRTRIIRPCHNHNQYHSIWVAPCTLTRQYRVDRPCH